MCEDMLDELPDLSRAFIDGEFHPESEIEEVSREALRALRGPQLLPGGWLGRLVDRSILSRTRSVMC